MKDPVISNEARVSLLKIKIENAYSRLLQGMDVKIFSSRLKNKVLMIPKAAIIYGNTNKVWKLVHKNTFEQITLNIGKEDSNNAEVLAGINRGDVIVTRGSYLINSEFLLKKIKL